MFSQGYKSGITTFGMLWFVLFTTGGFSHQQGGHHGHVDADAAQAEHRTALMNLETELDATRKVISGLEAQLESLKH